MRALLLLALVVALAGCADDPEPVKAGEPTFSDADVPEGLPLAPIEWSVIHEGSFALAAGAPYRAAATVPTGTLQVLANFTFEAGGASGILLTLGECVWDRDVTLVMGQTFGADCGGLSPANEELQVAIDAGAVSGRVVVVAAVCMPHQGRCPAPVPVQSG